MINDLRAMARPGKPAPFERALPRFLETAPTMAATIRDNRADKDADAVWRAAHSLKSSAAALGAKQLARRCSSIDHSGIRFRDAYARFDAVRRFAVRGVSIADPKSCQCGEVLKGVLKPWQCKVFGMGCTPETPVGALMVSSEGACAACYRYAGARAA